MCVCVNDCRIIIKRFSFYNIALQKFLEIVVSRSFGVQHLTTVLQPVLQTHIYKSVMKHDERRKMLQTHSPNYMYIVIC